MFRRTGAGVEGDLDPRDIAPGTFTMEWPRGSGQFRKFSELDRVAWFDLEGAGGKRRPRVKARISEARLVVLRPHLLLFEYALSLGSLRRFRFRLPAPWKDVRVRQARWSCPLLRVLREE